jgi:2-hydroxy-3-oxopropionate reductase
VRPLLECLGKRVVHIGPNGAGQVAKACNQMIMVAAIQAVAEAMRLAAAAGVDCARVKEALAGGSAASRVLDVMGERMVRRDFAAGIEARLHHKDFGLLAAARQCGVPVPLAAVVDQQLNVLMAQGWGRTIPPPCCACWSCCEPVRPTERCGNRCPFPDQWPQAGGFPAGRLCQGARAVLGSFPAREEMFLSTLLDAQADKKR